MEIGTWRTSGGDIDVLLDVPRTTRADLARFEQLADRASLLEVGGERVVVASLEDIIHSKEVSDRPKDREALGELRELWAHQQGERDLAREVEPPDFGFGL